MNCPNTKLAVSAFLTPSLLVRLFFLVLLSIQFILILLLAFEYRRKRLALHGNLKFLYVNLTIIYAFTFISSFISEFSALILTLSPASFSQQSAECAASTPPPMIPLWFTLLTKGPAAMIPTLAVPLHFVIMLERCRATILSKHYEHEGNKFGRISVAIIYICHGFATFFMYYLILSAANFDWNQLQSTSLFINNSQESGLFYFALSCFDAFLNILTAFGDLWIYKRNCRVNIVDCYNLSEKYQQQENRRAMRLILPLDILYLGSTLLASLIAILLNKFKDSIDLQFYSIGFNFCGSLFILYVIISLALFRRFLRQEDHRIRGTKSNPNQILPMEQVGRIYFDHLKAQWQYMR